MTLRPFDETLFKELRDPEFAAAYLQDALEDTMEEFLIAFRKYLQANGGVTKFAQEAELSRESVYRTLSETGSPEFRAILRLLDAAGIDFKFEARPKSSTRPTPKENEILGGE